MARVRFEVGAGEKHIIEASGSPWTAKVHIWVDGREITNKFQIGLSDRMYRFEVGYGERHLIELRIGGIVIVRFDLFVDGCLVGTA